MTEKLFDDYCIYTKVFYTLNIKYNMFSLSLWIAFVGKKRHNKSEKNEELAGDNNGEEMAGDNNGEEIAGDDNGGVKYGDVDDNITDGGDD